MVKITIYLSPVTTNNVTHVTLMVIPGAILIFWGTKAVGIKNPSILRKGFRSSFCGLLRLWGAPDHTPSPSAENPGGCRPV